MFHISYYYNIYAEVVIFWGHVDRLKDCYVYNDEVTNQEIKHLSHFWMLLYSLF